jgi:hypothetical protein
MLVVEFPQLSDMRVLDLGGTPWSWQYAPVRPRRVVTLNIDRVQGPPWVEVMQGDACDPPGSVREAHFDLIFSNSVIEHVGGRWRRQAFAKTVREMAPHHWVQTPARSFPIEPHWLFPGFQFLPVGAKAVISRRWKFAHVEIDSSDRGAALESVLDVELVSLPEFRHLFPDSRLVRERMFGLTKSLIATK